MADNVHRLGDLFAEYINGALQLNDEELRFVDEFTIRENPETGMDIVKDRFQGRHPSWLHDLVRGWGWLVYCLRRDNPIFLDSYPHRVSNRSYIQRFLDEATPELRKKVTDIIDPLDREFMRVTQPSTVPLPKYGGPSEGEYYAWQWRVPRRMSGEGKELVDKIAKYAEPPDEGYEWPPGAGDPFAPWVIDPDLLPPP